MKKLLSFIIALAYGASAMAAITIPNIVKVKLTSASSKSDEVTLYQAEDADDTQFQNGKDATKINFPMGEPSENVYIYVTKTYDQEYNLASMYVTDLTNQYLIFKTSATETSYTLTFPTIYPTTFSIKMLDWETGTIINVAQGASYAFTATVNTTYTSRFQIIPTYTVTTNVNGWASYSNSLDLVAESTPAGVTEPIIYSGEYDGAETLALTEQNGVKANTGVVIYGDPQTTYTLVPGTVTSYTSDLTASVTETTIDATKTNYCLTTMNGVSAFYEYTGTIVPANKAYLSVGATAAPRRIRLVMDAATGVESASECSKSVKFVKDGQLCILRDGVVYNMHGQVVR